MKSIFDYGWDVRIMANFLRSVNLGFFSRHICFISFSILYFFVARLIKLFVCAEKQKKRSIWIISLTVIVILCRSFKTIICLCIDDIWLSLRKMHFSIIRRWVELLRSRSHRTFFPIIYLFLFLPSSSSSFSSCSFYWRLTRASIQSFSEWIDR